MEIMKQLVFFNKVYEYEFTENYIKVNGKQLKLKGGLYGFTYKLNKNCISSGNIKDLLKWLNECIEDRFCLSLVKVIFDHVEEYGTE